MQNEELRTEHQDRLHHMLANSRKPAPTGWLGKEPPGEYALWSVVQAGGVPPPPEKHPLVNVHSYIKTVQISGPPRKPGEEDLPREVNP